MKLPWVLILFLTLLVPAGAGLQAQTETGPTPNFTVSLQPNKLALAPGGSGSLLVSISPVNGFDSRVDLTVTNLPAGLTTTFSTSAILAPPGSAILTLRAATDAAIGSFQCNVVAVGGGITNTTTTGPVTVNFGLIPQAFGAFGGTVTDAETGLPVSGAVLCFSSSGPPFYNCDYSAATDASGHYFRTNVTVGPDNAPRQYFIPVTRVGYWPAQVESYAVGDSVTELNLTLTTNRPAILSGTVTDPDNNPIASASVHDVVAGIGNSTFFGVTASDGTFRISGPAGPNNAPSTIIVQAEKTPFWPDSRSVMVVGGSNTVVHLILTPMCTGSITGQVVAADSGLPAAGRTVWLFRPLESGIGYQTDPSATTTTDANGYYGFANVLLGNKNGPVTCVVRAFQDNFVESVSTLVTLNACGQAAVAQASKLPPVYLSSVIGLVTDAETQQPLTNCIVSIGALGLGELDRVHTDTAGAYALTNLDLGTRTNLTRSLDVSSDGYYSFSTNVVLRAGVILTQDVRLLRAQSGAIAGTVRDSATRLPVAIASVRIGPDYAVTDKNGHYQSQPLPLLPGNKATNYAVTASADGYWSSTVSVVQASANTTNVVDIDLIQICTDANVVGTVVSAQDQKPIAGATVKSGNRSTRTDVNGSFVLTNITVGYGNTPIQTGVTASAPGFNQQTHFVTVFCGATIVLEFGQPQTVFGSIEGYVTNVLTGLPLTDVFMGSQFGGASVTDTNGYYTLNQVPLSANGVGRTWTVTAAPTGYAAQTKPVLVTTNSVARLDFGFGAPSTDLAVAITAAPDPVTVGSNLTYTVTVTNNGPAAATGVLVTNTLPAAVSFVSASGGVQPTQNLLIFAIGGLAAGTGTNLNVVVTPNSPGSITSSVKVVGDQADPNPGNNTAVVSATVNPLLPTGADLAVTIAATPNPVTVGDTLTYSFTVTDNGPTAATGVLVTNTLPAGVSFVSASGGLQPTQDLLIFLVGGLAVGTGTNINVVVTPNSPGSITSSVKVAGDQTDPNPDNNTAVASTTVQGPVVVTNLVAQVVSPLTLNRQTGLFEQRVKVINGASNDVAALRLLLGNLATNVVPYNASGQTEQGTWFVLYNQAIAAGETVEFLLEYYVANRQPGSEPGYQAESAAPVNSLSWEGDRLALDRDPLVAQGRLLIQFATVPGRRYAVEYSSDLGTWKAAVPPVRAAGNRVQWFDDGPPKTESRPVGASGRYYRVVLLPEN